MHTPGNTLTTERQMYLAQIIESLDWRLAESGRTLRSEIEIRRLYFRPSLVGYCNLACPFCHNEGAPKTGLIPAEVLIECIEAAAALGFLRVHFTGGEPLLHPELPRIVRLARRYVPQVGLTTNGLLLPGQIGELLDAGLNRVHVTLQPESLDGSQNPNFLQVLDRLAGVVTTLGSSHCHLRLNVPIPAGHLPAAGLLLRQLASYSCDVQAWFLDVCSG